MQTVYITSAKFAPGHFSHLLAYYKLFESINYKPILYLDKGYEEFIAYYPNYRYIYINKKSKAPNILFIYNLSPVDSSIIKKFKNENPNLKTIFVYHEPWYGFKGWCKDLIRKNESIIESIKAIGRLIASKKTVKKCNKVIFPSNNALKNYNKYCSNWNKNFYAFPLIFTDEYDINTSFKEKQYFSFISTASNSKNFKMFIEYVKYKSKKDANSMFQIATRTDISEYLDKELNELIDKKRLIVNHGHSLSNEEINKAYAISNCTWMLYNRSTQSGVLCKAFMFGSPVIASNIGSFSEVVSSENGMILNNNYTLDDIDKAYDKIKENLSELTIGARETFFKKFYWENYVTMFKSILH